VNCKSRDQDQRSLPKRDDELKREYLGGEYESTEKDAVKSPFLSFDGEVGTRAANVDESNEEHSHWNLRPSDHLGGKLRKPSCFGAASLTTTMRRGG
jgi:hypothetical protein